MVVQEIGQLSTGTLLLRESCAEEPGRQLKQALALAMEAQERLATADPSHAAMEARRLAVLWERAKYQKINLNACLNGPVGVLQTEMNVVGSVGDFYPTVEFSSVEDVFLPRRGDTFPSESDPY